MATVDKRELTAEETQEAARLRAAWSAYKSEHKGATQGWLAASAGLGTQGAVGQYLRGIIPLNVRALLAICAQIEVDPREISTRLTRDIDPGSLRPMNQGLHNMLRVLANKVENQSDLRILMQVILDEEPPEIPEHIRESIKSMVQSLRNLIQQSVQTHK